MSTATESAGASAVKVAMVAGGAALSGMKSVSDSLGQTAQMLIWFITIAYGFLQIIKCLPWFTDQSIAFWRGVRHRDWTRWFAIARRGEKSNDGGQ
jgi:hypothetical protein